MGSARRARLIRRLAVLTRLARAAVWRRETLRAQARAAAVIRGALDRAGLDPAPVSALRLVAGAAAALRHSGDTPERRRADAAFAARDPLLAAAAPYAAQAFAQAPLVGDRPPPAAGAALVDWYAWALAQAGRRAARRPRRTRGAFGRIEAAAPRPHVDRIVAVPRRAIRDAG